MSEPENLAERMDHLDERLEALALEARRAGEEGSRDRRRALVVDIGKLLTNLILAVAALVLPFVVTKAIREREVRVAEGEAAEDLMQILSKPRVELVEAEAAALGLAAYGPAAISPLLSQMGSSVGLRRIAAKRGLRALAIAHRQEVCAGLRPVLENRTRLFNAWTLVNGIELIGVANCQSSREELEGLLTRLESDGAESFLEEVVAPEPAVDLETLTDVRETVRESLRLLERGRRR